MEQVKFASAPVIAGYRNFDDPFACLLPAFHWSIAGPSSAPGVYLTSCQSLLEKERKVKVRKEHDQPFFTKPS